MRLAVRQTITFRHDRPMRMLVHGLRLTPSRFDGQKTLRWTVSAAGGREGSEFRDGAGDLVRTLSVRGPASEVRIEVDGVVDTTDLSGVLRGHREAIPPAAYLRETAATRADAATLDLARTVMAANEGSTRLSLAHALAGAVADRLEAEGDEGTDPAHLMIAAALPAGIPARYVSGYRLGDDDAGGNHGWAELWIDGLGWIGFDAAHRCCPDDSYIRLCSGADAADAAPVRAVTGPGSELSEVDVAVRQANQ
jgi:hypothetical protein